MPHKRWSGRSDNNPKTIKNETLLVSIYASGYNSLDEIMKVIGIYRRPSSAPGCNTLSRKDSGLIREFISNPENRIQRHDRDKCKVIACLNGFGSVAELIGLEYTEITSSTTTILRTEARRRLKLIVEQYDCDDILSGVQLE